MTKDTLFEDEEITKGNFAFDEKTANVFENMLTRSVPLYFEIQRMITELALFFVCNESNVYDIGCSTGTTLSNLAKKIDQRGVRLIGIDSSAAMLKKARQKNNESNRCIFINTDLNNDFEIKNASVVIMSLTLQFINPSQRDLIVKRIFNGLMENGCFIFIEKILSNDPKNDALFEKFYFDFKKRNYYSELEINRKKQALEGVLIPYTYNDNMNLLKRNGFKSVDGFFRWYNFCGIIAVKN
jgi:tRNA (cmo5U34)-methyltransferase